MKLSVIDVLQTYGVEMPKSFLQGEELRNAAIDIDILHENILKTHNENDTTLLEEQLAELEHACFTKMNLELAAYFKQGFKMGMRLAKELNDEE